jgi:formate hydrogenlyase subunit 3/multisubunit Na+/H+ antiporter MnhD subunit
MSAFAEAAQAFGPGLIAASLAAPLVVLAVFLSPRLRLAGLAMAPFAPLPALAAAVLALGGAPFGLELQALRMNFALDRPGAMLLAASTLVWMAAGVLVRREMTGEPNAGRFAVSWLLTMAGSLGVFVAADLLTFYLVYALVSVPAYYLIAHDGDAGSNRAAGVYMAFTLLGEAVLLLAFVMLAAGEPSGSLSIRDVVAALPASPWRDAALASLIIGFGMKMALAPLNGWMPLAYTAAPIPAAAVLSGAAVKAGVIGLIRFLPLSAAVPGWGEALAWIGFISAFYGVAIGLAQRDPKTALAYSSISQMGVIAAVLGLGLVGGDQSAAPDAAFYAANHVLVKAALFLTVGAVAALGGRGRSLALVAAAALALSLGGLPLTGGALAKLAVKGQLGEGLASAAAAASAAGTTALMLHFLIRLARTAKEPAAASPARLSSWLALAVASFLVPWLLYPALGGDLVDALAAATLWDAIWPMLVGAAIAAGLWALGDPLPRIPAGDIVVAQEAAFRGLAPLGALIERLDWGLRQWPAAGLSLLTIALALAAAGFAGR